jgi:hypothetical protein
MGGPGTTCTTPTRRAPATVSSVARSTSPRGRSGASSASGGPPTSAGPRPSASLGSGPARRGRPRDQL